MQQPFFIVGPTAVGKTGLAVRLAERCGAEIVSADAFQVYCGFDLLTAKPSESERDRVVHHMLGCVSPEVPYSVAQYLEGAKACIERIHKSGKRAFVVGGSGLYVKALTHGLSPLPPAQPEIRSQLEQLMNPELLAMLTQHDALTANTIDVNNKRRLVRALEVCLTTGKPFSSFRTQWSGEHPSPGICGVLLTRDRDDLISRINRRVDHIFLQGVVEEVRAHSEESLAYTADKILGLNGIKAFIENRCGLECCQEQLKVATRRYAKRQMTWFKREACFQAFNLTASHEDDVLDEIQEMVSGDALS